MCGIWGDHNSDVITKSVFTQRLKIREDIHKIVQKYDGMNLVSQTKHMEQLFEVQLGLGPTHVTLHCDKKSLLFSGFELVFQVTDANKHSPSQSFFGGFTGELPTMEVKGKAPAKH